MAQIGDASGGLGYQVQFGYDASGRPTSMVQSDNSGDTWSMYYTRDANDRVMYREYDTFSPPSSSTSEGWYYGYSDGGNAPSVELDSGFNVIEKYISLPGGVTATIYPQNTSQASEYAYNLPDLHGDTMLTTDGAGANDSLGGGPGSMYIYDPFGNPTYSDVYNVEGGNASWGWQGSHEIFTEDELSPQSPMIMGARIYLPGVGQFTSMDPIPGGNVNAYAYPLDPINFSDISGMCMALQGGCGTDLQNGVGATTLQPTVQGTYYQNTIGTYRAQAAAGIPFAYRGAQTAARIQAPVHHEDTLRFAVPDAVATVTAGPSNDTVTTADSVGSTVSTGGGGFDWHGAIHSGGQYLKPGGDVGAGIGCVAGAAGISVLAGPELAEGGCLIGAPVGSTVGAGVSAAYGFLAGGFNWAHPVLNEGTRIFPSPFGLFPY